MKKRLKIAISVALIFLLGLAIEVLLANFNYLSYGGNAEVIDYVCDTLPVTVEDESTQILTDKLGFEVSSFAITTDGYGTATLLLYENTGGGDAYGKVLSTEITLGCTEKVYFDTGAAAGSLLFCFDGIDESFTVSELVLNPSYSFNFNFVRFLLIFLVLLFIFFMCQDGRGKRIRAKMSLKAAKALAVAVCVIVCGLFTFLGATGESVPYYEYPLGGSVKYANPYIQQFDAFQKGQLNIDVEPSEELLELENPYDPYQRGDAEFMWDRAFYDGKYYSYFGVTPIFTVYYPFWLFTGKLPNDTTVKAVFALLAAIFLPLAVFEISRFSKEKLPPWMTAVAAIGAMFSSFVLIMQRGNAQFYYIAVLAATAFLSLFAFLSMKALHTQKASSRLLLLAGAGVAFGLGFHSRINTMLPAAAAAVAMLAIYFVRSIKSKRLGEFFKSAAALGIPVAAALALSFAYNYARFGSVFEFGTSYQLTVLETSRYSLNLNGIIPCIFFYFLHPLLLTGEFPLLKTQAFAINGYNRPIYIDQNFGLFTMPFTLLMLVGIYMIFSRKTTPTKRIMLGVGTASVFLTAFVDFCLGGVVFRYVGDIAPSAALISAFVLLELLAAALEDGSTAFQKAVKYGGTLLCLLTAFSAIAVSLNTGVNFFKYSPEIYSALASFFVFWQ